MLKQTSMIIAVALLSSVMVTAKADPADVNLTKASLNADFNKMIDEGAHVKNTIQKNLDDKLNAEDPEEASSDKSKVLDFVDVEVGWGSESPSPIVDRRFDSVSDPQPIDLNSLVPKLIFEPGI